MSDEKDTTVETEESETASTPALVNVYNNRGQWVGFFYNYVAAVKWIAGRANPGLFDIRSGAKDTTTPVARGIYPPRGDKRLADADEFGFLADPTWPKPKGAKKGENTDRDATVEVPLHALTTHRGDDSIMDKAIRDSLATDRTDDNTRENVGTDLSE